jgi:hypothetical protein
MTGLILYTTDDGRSQIKLRAKNQTVWLTQKEMSQLFDVSTDNVGLHLKNLFADGELEEKAVAEDSSVTAADQQDEAELKALETKIKGRSPKWPAPTRNNWATPFGRSPKETAEL